MRLDFWCTLYYTIKGVLEYKVRKAMNQVINFAHIPHLSTKIKSNEALDV